MSMPLVMSPATAFGTQETKSDVPRQQGMLGGLGGPLSLATSLLGGGGMGFGGPLGAGPFGGILSGIGNMFSGGFGPAGGYGMGSMGYGAGYGINPFGQQARMLAAQW